MSNQIQRWGKENWRADATGVTSDHGRVATCDAEEAPLLAAAPAMAEALAGLVEAIEKLSTPELKAIPEPLRSALAYGYVHGRNALKAAAPEPTPRATATRLAATEPGA
jgi:hypothetical protein